MLSMYHLYFTLSHSAMYVRRISKPNITVKKILPTQGTGCQVHAIDKAIRSLFVDRVTIMLSNFLLNIFIP